MLHVATSLLSSLTPSIGPLLPPWRYGMCIPAGTEAPLLANVLLGDDGLLMHDHVLGVIDSIDAAFDTALLLTQRAGPDSCRQVLVASSICCLIACFGTVSSCQ
ncbi:unnamed protein product [Polarella glacialis]|uniref:Uncharacterized protein n=1 Tax=Polarella glacialis TaxID=89957 RepID=A0A813D7Z9_POLGL|nr:unnamed protein product [Polarella glacialis]